MTRLLLWALLVVVASVGLLASVFPGAADARSAGPEYTYTRYALERSSTSAITRLQIPVYFEDQPNSNRQVNITNFERGSTAVSINIVGVGDRSGNGSFTLTPSDFSFHTPTQTWRAVIDVRLNASSTHYSHYVLFRLNLSNTAGHIGYTGSFAQAAQEYGNWNAAGDDFVRTPIRSYSFDMATPCNITSNTVREISLYDLDSGNDDNGGRTVSVTVVNLTTGQTLVSQTGGSGMGQGQTWTRDITFRPDHRYRVTLHDISANNMIRYTFPFDDVNEAIACPSPATVRPYTRVNGTAGGTAYINPSQTAEFIAFTRVSNYNRMNHSVTTRIERQIDGTGGWTTLADRNFTANGNGDTTNWGAVNIGLNTTVGGNIPNNAREFCYRASILSAGGANVTGSPSAESCARVRYGETRAGTNADSEIEVSSGESATLIGRMTTQNFRDWGNSNGDYSVSCSYSVAITAGAGAGSNNGTLAGGANSGSCDATISGNGDITVATRTYSTNGTTRVGSRACLTVTLAVSDFVAAAQDTATVCATVVAKPTFKTYGADVSVGGACDTSAGILAHNRGSVGTYAGSSSAFAAFAAGNITGFGTQQGGSAAGGWQQLAFANRNGTGGNNYSASKAGGNFTGTSCVPDYYGSRPAGTAFNATTWATGHWNQANSAGAANPGQPQIFHRTGNLTINGGQLQEGTNVKIYVDGNVYIDGNIGASDVTTVLETINYSVRGTRTVQTQSGRPLELRYSPWGLGSANAAARMDNWTNGWSQANCVNLNESREQPGGPYTPAWPSGVGNVWQDNHICANQDVGLQFSYTGTVSGKTCVNMANQARNGTSSYSWWDNYICVNSANGASAGLEWVQNYEAGPSTKSCIEISDSQLVPGWEADRHKLCWLPDGPAASAPATPTVSNITANPDPEDGGHATVTWNAPSGPAGSIVRDYVFQYRVGSGSWVSLGDTAGGADSIARSTELNGLRGGVSYGVRIGARNAAGVTYSAERTFTATALPAPSTGVTETTFDPSGIPLLTIVARGNIVISGSVTQIYGSLIAQQGAVGTGLISTCGSSATAPRYTITANNYFTACESQLRIIGSLSAERVLLMRTGGTMARHGTGANDFKIGGSGYQQSAEIVEYNPLTWAQPAGYVSTSPTVAGYDAITTLPPVQ